MRTLIGILSLLSVSVILGCGEDSTVAEIIDDGRNVTTYSEKNVDVDIDSIIPGFDGIPGVELDDDVKGDVTKVVVTDNDGNIVSEDTTVSTEDIDGNPVVIISETDCDNTGCETSVVVKDKDGNTISDSSISNSEKNGEIIELTNITIPDGTLVIDGEEVSGTVHQTVETRKDHDNNTVKEEIRFVEPNDGSEIQIAPPVNGVILSDGTVANVNIPISMGSDVALAALKPVFESHYGIQFDEWNLSPRVIPLIMAEIPDYDSTLTLLRSEGKDVLKNMLVNYPMINSMQRTVATTPAGKNFTIVTNAINSSDHLYINERMKEAIGTLNANPAMAISFENDSAIIVNGAARQGEKIASAANVLGLDNSYWHDAGEDSYLKHVEEMMGVHSTSENTNLGNSSFVFLLAPPGKEKKLVCVAMSTSPACDLINDVDNMQEKTWIAAFPSESRVATEWASSAFEAERFLNTERSLDNGARVVKAFTVVAKDGSLRCNTIKDNNECEWIDNVAFARHTINHKLPLTATDGANNFKVVDSGAYLYLYNDVNDTGKDGLKLTGDGNDKYLKHGTGGADWLYRLEYQSYAPWEDLRFGFKTNIAGLKVVTPDESEYYIYFADEEGEFTKTEPEDMLDNKGYCQARLWGSAIDLYPSASIDPQIKAYVDAWNAEYGTDYSADDIDWLTCYRYKISERNQHNEPDATNDKYYVMKDGSFLFFAHDSTDDEPKVVAGLEHLKGAKGHTGNLAYPGVVFFDNDQWYFSSNRVNAQWGFNNMYGGPGTRIFEWESGVEVAYNNNLVKETANQHPAAENSGYRKIYGMHRNARAAGNYSAEDRAMYMHTGGNANTYGPSTPVKEFAISKNSSGLYDWALFSGTSSLKGDPNNERLRELFDETPSILMSNQKPHMGAWQQMFYHYDDETQQFGLAIINSKSDITVDNSCIAYIKPDSEFASSTACDESFSFANP